MSKDPKAASQDDPFEMHAQGVAGDPFLMVDHIIEEFAQMGWDSQKIARLFEDPFYRATHQLGLALGSDAVRNRIKIVLSKRGVIRISTPVQLKVL